MPNEEEKIWFIHFGDRQEGPLSREEVRSKVSQGLILQRHLVWRQGMEKWEVISEVESIRSLFSQAAKAAPQPPQVDPIQSLPPPAPPKPVKTQEAAVGDVSGLIEIDPHSGDLTRDMDVSKLREAKKEAKKVSKIAKKAEKQFETTHLPTASTMKVIKITAWIIIVLLIAVAVILFKKSWAYAADQDKNPPTTTQPAMPSTGGEKLNIDSLKQKYWAKGNETELRVVQNRHYSKALSLELGFFGGITSTDPFLSVKTLGANLGFHFSEYLSIHFVGWRSFTTNSSALDTFQQKQPTAIVNTNRPSSFYGGEIRASLIYGKLSFIGKAILYYDMYLLGGLGNTGTESGTYLTPFLGIGQQIYLTRHAALQINFRHMGYNENVLDHSPSAPAGKVDLTRMNYSDTITLGIVGFLNFFN